MSEGGYLIEPRLVPALERMLAADERVQLTRQCDTEIEDYDQYSAEKDKYDLLREFVEDLASKGTRHDPNPTMCFDNMWSVADRYAEYIRDMDDSIRERAARVLKQVDGK